MSAMKNGQISLYCHFNKIIKEHETRFQSPNLGQIMLEIFVLKHTSIWLNFIFKVLRIQKKQALPMMTPQKQKNLDISRTKQYFFFELKKLLITRQGLLYDKKYFWSGDNL